MPPTGAEQVRRVVVLPVRPIDPVLQLRVIPSVELGHPLVHVVNGPVYSGHAAECHAAYGHDAAVDEEGRADDGGELTQLKQLAHEPALLDAVSEGGNHLGSGDAVVAVALAASAVRPAARSLLDDDGGAPVASEKRELASAPLHFAVGPHGLLKYPSQPVGDCVEAGPDLRHRHGVGQGRAVLLDREAAQEHERGDAIGLGHPVRPRHPLQPAILQLRQREFRREAHLVDVAVAQHDGHAVGVLLLEGHARADDADGAADQPALVAQVAADDQVPAVAQRDVCCAARVGRRRHVERIRHLDESLQELPVALDIGQEGYLGPARRNLRRGHAAAPSTLRMRCTQAYTGAVEALVGEHGNRHN
eukprot:scaffold34976_cov112-Isochrysis_galbana.AAC.4